MASAIASASASNADRGLLPAPSSTGTSSFQQQGHLPSAYKSEPSVERARHDGDWSPLPNHPPGILITEGCELRLTTFLQPQRSRHPPAGPIAEGGPSALRACSLPPLSPPFTAHPCSFCHTPTRPCQHPSDVDIQRLALLRRPWHDLVLWRVRPSDPRMMTSDLQNGGA
jgi:hypothetical protein